MASRRQRTTFCPRSPSSLSVRNWRDLVRCVSFVSLTMPQFARCSYLDGVLQTFGLDDGQFHCNRCNVQLCGTLDWVEHCDSSSHRTAEDLFGLLGYLPYRAFKRIHIPGMFDRHKMAPPVAVRRRRLFSTNGPSESTYLASSRYLFSAAPALDYISEESLDRLGELENDTPYKCLCCDAWLFGLPQLRHHIRNYKHLRTTRCVHAFGQLVAIERLRHTAHLTLSRYFGSENATGCYVRRLIAAFIFDYRVLCRSAGRLLQRDLSLGLWRRLSLRLRALDLHPAWWRRLSRPIRP